MTASHTGRMAGRTATTEDERAVEMVARALKPKHGVPDSISVAETAITARLLALAAINMSVQPIDPPLYSMKDGEVRLVPEEPEGHVLVPKVPTGELLQAGADADPRVDARNEDAYAIGVTDVGDIYVAMIKAHEAE